IIDTADNESVGSLQILQASRPADGGHFGNSHGGRALRISCIRIVPRWHGDGSLYGTSMPCEAPSTSSRGCRSTILVTVPFSCGPAPAPLNVHTQVQSRMGAVAWGHWPTLRFPSPSSNRACRFPALGFPIGFTTRPTMFGRFMLASSDDTLGTERIFAFRYDL